MQKYTTTYTILFINVSIFILLNIIFFNKSDKIMHAWGFLPQNNSLTLITYSFLHNGLSHIIFNMVGLICYGRIVEREVGSKNTLYLYLFAAVIPMLLQHFFSPSNLPTIGASAAICGLVGTSLLIENVKTVFRLLSVLIILKEFYLIFAYNPIDDGIAHFAHAFGFLTGFLWILFKSDDI